MDWTGDVIKGQGMIEMLRGVMEYRNMCRMQMLHTSHEWLTLVLGIRQERDDPCLLVDRVAGFEQIVSRRSDREVLLEFVDRDRVPCRFKTRVIECEPKAIRVELPDSILRLQRRGSFRVWARSGVEILFYREGGTEAKARVRDYGLGGVAFWAERCIDVRIDEELKGISLRISEKDRSTDFNVPRAVVRRVENHSSGEILCALEFLEMTEAAKERLWRHLFREERLALEKVRRS